MENKPSILEGKVAIVTGASRGLGKAMALELARAGASVAVAARTVEVGRSPLPGTIHETVDEIEKLGRNAMAVRCDVTREDDVEELIKKDGRDLRLCTTCGGPMIVPVELKRPKESDIKVKIGNNTLYISKVQARYLRRIDKPMLEYYTVEEVQPVDMFPHTYHIESVVRLELK